jgi:hypothetical protein
MELLRTIQLIELYYKNNGTFFKSYNIDSVPFNIITQLIKQHENDPEWCDSYDLDLYQATMIDKFLKEKIIINFELYDYVFIIRGVYRYSDGSLSI